MSGVGEAASAIAYAGITRREKVEVPIRAELEKIGYGYPAFVAEAEARGWTVTLESQWHIMVWKQTPKPYAKADSVYDPERGELIGSWLDSEQFTIDHLARCLRAEMAVLGTWPTGLETQRLEAALAAITGEGKD